MFERYKQKVGSKLLHGPDMSGAPSHSRGFSGRAGIGWPGLKRSLTALPDTQEPVFQGTMLERDLPNRVCPGSRFVQMLNYRLGGITPA